MQKRSQTEDNDTLKIFHNTMNPFAIHKLCNTGYKGNSFLVEVPVLNKFQPYIKI